MNDAGFWIFLIFILFLYANEKGDFDKFIKDKNYKEVIKLQELRKLDQKVIEDLQERLKKAGLDSSIG